MSPHQSFTLMHFSAPHIGHLHSMVIADVLSRYNKLKTNQPSFMITGTDEHGIKIERTAMKNSQTPTELCDSVSIRFRELAKAGNIGYDDFIRTTESRHHLAVQTFWNRLFENGHIYKGKYSGWYSVSDETYYAPNQVQSRNPGEMISIETGQVVEWIEEENYMFKLSEFQPRLIEWLSQNPTALISSQKADIINQLQSKELPDLSISRPTDRLKWGIQVPHDPNQIIYVWIDALTNYLTVTGYPWSSDQVKKEKWPPNVQVIGKDITRYMSPYLYLTGFFYIEIFEIWCRFHAIYWPAMLMGAGLELPKSIIAHAHWTMKDEKISKSRGNVVDPFESLKEWGIDGLRYYLMAAPGSLWNDTDWAPDRVDEHYRKDLAGQLGNLLSRISNPKLWSRFPIGLKSGTGLFYPPQSFKLERSKALADLISNLPDEVDRSMSSFEIPKALKVIFQVLTESNRLISEIAPWHSSTGSDESHECIYLCAESIRFSVILLQAFMPEKSDEILNQLGIPLKNRTWTDLKLGAAIGVEVLASNGFQAFPNLIKAEKSLKNF
ncbi:hypothetical protein DFH28DRAFT_1159537 [Melampsora americana]|nr:hypothetical protein DFH28DRAFT_1159537 [Melampsora americana]